VWLRTLFDAQGNLYWWGIRNTETGLTILARGQSPAGAEDELAIANLRFILATERIWACYQSRPIAESDDDLLLVEQFYADERP